MFAIALPAGLVSLVLMQPAPSTEQLDTWVRELGSPTLSVRRAATDNLWKAGDAAQAALEKAVESSDLEVVTRARYVLDRIRAGVIPGADPEVTRAVEQFRFGDRPAKQQAFDLLLRKGEIDRLRWLLDREKDPVIQAEFNQRLVGDLLRLAVDKLVDAQDKAATDVLEEVARRGGAQHLATYLHLTGQAEARLAKLAPSDASTTVNASTNSVDSILRFHFARLKGDLATAKSVAEQSKNLSWLAAVQHAGYDWPALLATRSRSAPAGNASVLSRVRHWGSVAVLARAAGNTKVFDEATRKLLDLRESASANELQGVADVFVLLGDLPQAEQLLRGQRPVRLAELLMFQGRYREAFDALAIHNPREQTLAWFKQLDPQDPRVKIQDPAHPFHAGRLAARMLYMLGEREPALALFAELAQLNSDAETRKFAVLQTAKSEFDLGSADAATVEQCERHIAEAIELWGYAPVYRTLLPRSNVPAERWYARLSEQQPQATKASLVRQVRQLLSNVYRPRMADDAWKKIIDDTSVAIETLNERERGGWWRLLADACIVRGERARGIELLKTAAAAEPVTGGLHLLRLGDLYSSDSAWTEAAATYDQAWKRDRRQALPLLLHGYALSNSGDSAQGDKRIALARLLPLGDTAARHALGMGLKERNLNKLAVAEFDLETRLSQFTDFNVLLAGQELAQQRGTQEPTATINYWQLMIARVIELGASIDRDGVLRLPQNIHRLRVIEQLQQQKFDTLAQELEAVQKFVPHDGSVVLNLLGRMNTPERKAEADAVFERGYTALASIVQDFPRAALYHNNLAWLAGRCARRLDEGLKHAERAVELTPDHPGHLDTLAEVQFQRGNRAEAIRLEKRAAELDPHNRSFPAQLERFEKGEPGPVFKELGER